MATLYLIPLVGGTDTHYSQITPLDGRSFTLKLEWNERGFAWFLSLYDSDGGAIVESRKMVIDSDLLDGLVGDARPPGQMLLVDVSGGYTEATFASLGTQHQLHYVAP